MCDEIKQYFIEVVAPFAKKHQNQTVKSEQLPEMPTAMERVDIMHMFFHDLVSFVREKSPDEVR